jgi:hypothetical protein
VTATLKGVGKNIVDTGKAVVDLVKFAVNVQLYMPIAYAGLVMKVVQGELSIATELQEFKTSIDRGITTVKESLESFYSKVEHAWENPEEFQARLQLQAEIADYQKLYRRAFDAEGYHLEQSEQAGYWLGEILQWTCGGEKLLTALAQGAVKSARWVKLMGELGEGVKIFKEGQEVIRVEQEIGIKMLQQGIRNFAVNEAEIHFAKHGNKVMEVLGKRSYSIAEYLEDASHIIKNGIWVPELNGYVKLIGGLGKAKYGFVGLDRITGSIRTFHIKIAEKLATKAPSLGLKYR